MPDADSFEAWCKKLDGNALNIWRESMAQLRQLHSDVWNGVRFFLTVNGILLAAIFGLAKLQDPDFLGGVLLGSL